MCRLNSSPKKTNMKTFILSIIVLASASCNPASQSKSEPVTIIAPVSKSSNFETNDSSFLKLKIKEDKFKIDFLNKELELDNITALDTFFQKNIARINKEKIVITGFDTTKNKNLTGLLAKYGISNFRINVEETH